MNTRIWFVSPGKNHGTFLLRGKQVAAALKKEGFSVGCCLPRQLNSIKNAIVVLVKHINADYAAMAKKSGNRVVWDVLDGYGAFQSETEAVSMLDGVIFSTRMQLADFGGLVPAPASQTVIYHHIDTRLTRYAKPGSQSSVFKMAYIGLPPAQAGNASFLNKITGLTVVPVDTKNAGDTGWMRKIQSYNCHYSMRDDLSQVRFKPLAKISVAAACAANIITNRDSAAQELLGSDYPYLSGGDFESITETIEKARNTFGKADWNTGLEIMRSIKNRLNLSTQAREWGRFFDELS